MGIRVFDDADFKGDNLHLSGLGKFDFVDVFKGTVSGAIIDAFDDSAVENDEISSYIIDPLTKVTFFEHINGGGESFVEQNFSPTDPLSVAQIRDGWNDRVSSIEIQEVDAFRDTPPTRQEETRPGLKGVTVFEDWRFNRESPKSNTPFGFGARAQTFDAGEYPSLPHNVTFDWRTSRFFLLGVRPNTISSIIVGTGYYVELYDQENFLGNKLTIGESAEDIRVLAPDKYSVTLVEQAKIWNDRTMSLKVFLVPVLK